MERWISGNLSNILHFAVGHDLIECIMRMQNERDLDEYLTSLLDPTDPTHRQFINELKERRATAKETHLQGYMKAKNNKNENVGRKHNEKKKGRAKGKKNPPPDSSKPEKAEKKKTKFVNLYSDEGRDRQTVKLQGRHVCTCEASRHDLVNNCTNCGRIVCSQEGAGPCFFCGDPVRSQMDAQTTGTGTNQRVNVSGNGRQANQSNNRATDQRPLKGFEESLEQRNKMLEYDRDSASRTKVIDDQCDYYRSSNTWLPADGRKRLKELEEQMDARKHAPRANVKVTLDFMGRQVVAEEDDEDREYNEEELKVLLDSVQLDRLGNLNICPSINFDRPMYIDDGVRCPSSRRATTVPFATSKLQDKQYVELVDEGLCLSLHQPYASLMVAGIKTHEGRTWYSAHRGKLWIAAASRTPDDQEISDAETYCRNTLDENIKFPDRYPVSCLLGCVTVVDCLPQEEYISKYPDGKSDSPYVFICENAYALPIKFPIQGKHKIYKLDTKIHQAAAKCLENVPKNA